MKIVRYFSLLLFSLTLFVSNAYGQSSLPEPIPGRIGYVGGIESIQLDKKIYYFGYSYSNDLVLSPLIDDSNAMAEFAAKYMAQRDGKHNPDYWKELVLFSRENSDLASDKGDRTFSTKRLKATVKAIADAEALNKRIPGVHVPYHLTYLLGSASRTDIQSDNLPSLKSLKFGEDWSCGSMIDESAKIINGKVPLPKGAEYRDAAKVVKTCLNFLVNEAPGNWKILFSVLTSPTSQ